MDGDRRILRPANTLPLDGSKVTVVGDDGVIAEKYRLDTCMMGIGSETLTAIIEGVAQRVIQLQDERAANLVVKEPTDEGGPYIDQSTDGPIWKPE